jgi:hypothetical protein
VRTDLLGEDSESANKVLDGMVYDVYIYIYIYICNAIYIYIMQFDEIYIIIIIIDRLFKFVSFNLDK